MFHKRRVQEGVYIFKASDLFDNINKQTGMVSTSLLCEHVSSVRQGKSHIF
jgi:hypothetical protein